LAVLSLVAVACSSTHYVHIRHPLQVGQVDPNAVPFENSFAENERGLPGGTLVDEASLTEVTPERVCAHVRLWSVETNPERGIFQNYQVSLLNDQDGVENSQAQISPEQPVTTPMQGHIARTIQTGTRQVCSYYNSRGYCTGWTTQPVYQTYYEPHVWQVTSYPASLCFQNGGFVTPSTTRISLDFDPSQGGGNFVFQWVLDSAVANTPPPPQQQQTQPQQQLQTQPPPQQPPPQQ